jgi:hypothetical protein
MRARVAVLGALWVAGTLMVAAGALANEGKPSKGGSGPGGASSSQPGGGPGAEGGRPMGAEGRSGGTEASGEQEQETPFRVGLDVVVGTGQTAIANSAQPTAVEAAPGNTLGTSQVTTESLLVGASVEVHDFEFGARIPLTFGQINPTGEASRAISAFGNLELEVEYTHHFSEALALRYALGIALPTAQGQDVPAKASDLVINANGIIDQSSYDRGVLNLAAASSRGLEETALFEVSRFGIVPKVELVYEKRGLVLEPYVKLENLIDTSGKADHKYLGELVIGGRVAYRLLKHVEPTVRIWTNLRGELTGISEDKPVAAVEPQLRFPFHNVTGIVGGILPFAGPLTSPYFLGIRAGLVVRF